MHSLSSLLPKMPLTLSLKPNTTYCRLCGEAFSHPFIPMRQAWSYKHAETHSEHQHRLLELSGRHLTPEAAQKLQHIAIPVVDLVVDDEVAQALREALP
jgi:hypothetical protein